MLPPRNVGDHRMRAGRDQDGLGRQRAVAVGEPHRVRILEHGAGQEAGDAGLLQGAGIDSASAGRPRA